MGKRRRDSPYFNISEVHLVDANLLRSKHGLLAVVGLVVAGRVGHARPHLLAGSETATGERAVRERENSRRDRGYKEMLFLLVTLPDPGGIPNVRQV